MKNLFVLLLLSISLPAQVGVSNLAPIGISHEEAKAVASSVQIELTRVGIQVVERHDLKNILEEQALQQSGALGESGDQSGSIQSVDSLVTGYAGITEHGYFLLLKLVDVKTGKVLSSDEIEIVGSLENLLGAAGICVRRLLDKKPSEINRTIRILDKPIGVLSKEVIHKHHVYEHAPNTHNEAMFVPCPLCGGRGKLSDGQDCNRCNISSMYMGPETGWTWMTGRWIR